MEAVDAREARELQLQAAIQNGSKVLEVVNAKLKTLIRKGRFHEQECLTNWTF